MDFVALCYVGGYRRTVQRIQGVALLCSRQSRLCVRKSSPFSDNTTYGHPILSENAMQHHALTVTSATMRWCTGRKTSVNRVTKPRHVERLLASS